MIKNQIVSLEIEKEILAGLFSLQNIYHSIQLYNITEKDFTKQNRVIYSIIDRICSSGGSISPAVVLTKLAEIGLINDTEINYPIYINGISQIPVTEKACLAAAKELKLVSVKRQIIQSANNTIEKIVKLQSNSLSEIVAVADNTFNEYVNLFNTDSGIVDLTSKIEKTVEERGNNPVDFIGLKGPFDTVNNIYGSLSRDASITLVGARSGVGKTKLGMFYNFYLAEKYNLPILHMDFGEMTEEELIWRAAACLSGSDVPIFALETGQWRKNQELVDKVRKIGLPRAKKLRMHYIDVSDMSPLDIISTMRRYSTTVVGRDNKFLVHYDYLKPFDEGDEKEHILMGKFIKTVKSFLKNELPIPFWCSIQQNRLGTNSNRSAADDSANSFSISDRIYQQTNHSFIFRFKTPLEIASDGVEFGNAKLIFVKTRTLGEKHHLAAYVKDEKGNFVQNYINLEIDGFNFYDRGSFFDVVKKKQIEQADLSEKSEINDDLELL